MSRIHGLRREYRSSADDVPSCQLPSLIYTYHYESPSISLSRSSPNRSFLLNERLFERCRDLDPRERGFVNTWKSTYSQSRRRCCERFTGRKWSAGNRGEGVLLLPRPNASTSTRRIGLSFRLSLAPCICFRRWSHVIVVSFADPRGSLNRSTGLPTRLQKSLSVGFRFYTSTLTRITY